MFNHSIYENSRPDGFGVLEVNDASADSRQPRLFVPLVRTELAGEITGPLASLRLTQVFRYSREQWDRSLEALYRFPLPGDAAVTGVTVRFGEVEIRAELKEREQAEAEYARARSEGRSAALTTRESPDVFTLQVSGLQPDQEIRVETTYVQLARVEGLDWALRVPLTTSPRYVRAEEEGSRHAAGQPLFLLRDPGHRFCLDVLLQGAGAVESTTHRLEVIPGEEGLRVRLQDGEVLPDRDCLLRWRPPLEEERPGLRLLLHRQAEQDQVYFLGLVTPPARPGRLVPREVVLLVDHSGSMEGAKWEASDWAAKQFLSGLAPEDRFALGLFHSATYWFRRETCAATPENVNAAIRYLEKARDSGGTELGTALEQALDLPRTAGEMARHVLIITDAEVTDDSHLLSLADQESDRPEARRISVLCIDAAPNSLLATQLAERGGGVARFLTSSPREEDITTALDSVLEDWSAPVLTGLRLEVDRPRVEPGSHRAAAVADDGWSALALGDLPSGRAVWVSGRVPAQQPGGLTFRLRTAAGEEIAARRPRLEGAACPALPALFGARRLLELERLLGERLREGDERIPERLRALGYDPAAVLKPGATGSENPVHGAIHSLLVQEALRYGLACQETAFIAQRWEAGEPVAATVAVANGLPHGWSDDFAEVYCRAAPSPSPGSRGAGTMRRFRRSAGRMAASPRVDIIDAMRVSYSLNVDDATLLAESADSAESRIPPLFSGELTPTGPETVLFDSDREPARLPGAASFSRLTFRFIDTGKGAEDIDLSMALLLYVGDLAAPRVRVRLCDLLRLGGVRPIHLQRAAGERVVLALADPKGAWAQGSPGFEVGLA